MALQVSGFLSGASLTGPGNAWRDCRLMTGEEPGVGVWLRAFPPFSSSLLPMGLFLPILVSTRVLAGHTSSFLGVHRLVTLLLH